MVSLFIPKGNEVVSTKGKIEDWKSFVIADIPGLIEGAHSGTGLGFQFLRHIERTSVLVHMVDISEMVQNDPIQSFEQIMEELSLFDKMLVQKPMIVVGTKLDISGDKSNLNGFEQYCKNKELPFFAISAVTKHGVSPLLKKLHNLVESIKKEK